MSFINLKVKRDKGDYPQEVTAGKSDNAPYYDYGTRISFNKKVLEKLGIDVSSANVGDKMQATVKLEVISVRQSKQTEGNDSSMELQITDIDLGEVKEAPGAKKIADYKKIRDQKPTEE